MNARKSLVIFTTFAILLLIAPIVNSQESIPKTIEYTVTADTANLRSGAGTNYAVVGTIVKGESILVYDETPETSGWLRVYRPGEDDAFIADFLIERAPMRFYPINQEPILVASGTGTSTTEIFDIPQGAYRIDATVSDRTFILESVTVEGDCRDRTLFNELNFDVTQLNVSGLFISTGCSVIFQTDNVDGKWEFALRDILDADAFAETLVIIENGTTIAGTGRTLTMATQLPEGIWTISIKVNDQAFILVPQILKGECEDSSLFNELNFDTEVIEASTLYRSEEEGCFIFWETENVEGSWEILFEQIK